MVKGKVRHFTKVYWDQIDGLKRGNFTVPMLLTMALLHRYADWKTGELEYTSAATLVTLSRGAYAERTFSEALRRLEKMGYITRHMEPGSHDTFPVTIHNFEVVETGEDGVDFIVTVNPKRTITWREARANQCDDACDDACDEHGDEHGDERAMKQGMIDATNHGTSTERPEGVCDERAMSNAMKDAMSNAMMRATNQDRLPDGTSRKTIQRESEKEPEQQQQLAAAALAPSSSEEQKPKTTEIEIESKSLARRFWEYLGSPEKFNSSRWEKQFSELLSTYPDLGDILEFAFEKDSTKTWRNRLLGANTPVPYLVKVIVHIKEAYDKWLPLEAERTEKAAVLCMKDAVRNLLASGEVFVRDGHNYKFMAVAGHQPCYHEVDAQGNPIGVIGNLVLGLDLPLPEDALEDAGFDV
ncbi:MAG: hypothetical protein LAO04_16770 [Acidobacteriia bacterium]|nr:hypothetical protein [Terriglobia bacterium]